MTLASYLKKWAAFHFSNFAPEWIDQALEGWGEGREFFLTDLAWKYPAFATAAALNSEICDVLETDAAMEACLFHRLSRSIFLRDPEHPSLRYFAHLMRAKTGMEIYHSTEIGPRLIIMHGTGVVIGPRNRIGSDFIIYQNVTLGQRHVSSGHQNMVIGNHCTIFAGAKILGSVKLGDHVNVGANAVLLTDAESNSTYAGVPAVKVAGRQQP